MTKSKVGRPQLYKSNEEKNQVRRRQYRERFPLSSIVKKGERLEETYFDVIDTEVKAYMLGFLFADGCNDSDNNRVSINLCAIDGYILRRFSSELYGSDETKTKPARTNISTLGTVHTREQQSFIIYSKYICSILTTCGMVKHKSYRMTVPDNIPASLLNHFVRGYFDGDGSIGSYTLPNRICPKYRVNFTTASEQFCISIRQIIEENTGVLLQKKEPKNGKYWRLDVGGNDKVHTLCEWLYKDSSIFLSRKHIKYQQLIIDLENKIARKSSQYKGVSYAKNMKKWLAYYTIGKKQIKLGYCETEHEAQKLHLNRE